MEFSKAYNAHNALQDLEGCISDYEERWGALVQLIDDRIETLQNHIDDGIGEHNHYIRIEELKELKLEIENL